MRIQLALGPRCLTLSSDNVVRITDIVRFKLSPLPRTGRGSTSSPRTSVLPKFNFQSAVSLSRRIPRQPLIIPTAERIVKCLPQLHDSFFAAVSSDRHAKNTRPAPEPTDPSALTQTSAAEGESELYSHETNDASAYGLTTCRLTIRRRGTSTIPRRDRQKWAV
jgi:hypothetical protein